MLETVWFVLVAGAVTAYVILDGYDLGLGIVHRFVGRTREERGLLVQSIGPVWDGNEVWLIATGASLLFAFPAAYAGAFSGFYLPLIMVLWLLMGRACAVDLRRKVVGSSWITFWDSLFVVSSVLLAFAFGAALGNVIRGVPLDARGSFFEPLWTHLGVRGETGILDWYTTLVALHAVAALAMHGAAWVAHKHEGVIQARARRAARLLWWVVGAGSVAVTAATFDVQPHVGFRLSEEPVGYVFPALAVLGWAGSRVALARRRDREAFLASSTYLAGMLASAAFGIYPFVLPSNADPAMGLTIHNASSAPESLRAALWWWIPGMLLAIGGQVFAYRVFRGKFRPDAAEY